MAGKGGGGGLSGPCRVGQYAQEEVHTESITGVLFVLYRNDVTCFCFGCLLDYVRALTGRLCGELLQGVTL